MEDTCTSVHEYVQSLLLVQAKVLYLQLLLHFLQHDLAPDEGLEGASEQDVSLVH